ncbi:alpha/beta fold hydrolase [Sphingobacterium hungaricum]|uniref:3-oxoadipate enol-lactonase n=1 Tax=Sphingobacterium hungaricum TaxID=2082723 RepID=A0A928UWR0_9SPHI|nr:alpha/beta fold hydrolase [Sphingobacterium hungaricum]MBE8712172.1 3-oxoadipate enol-lactonase [Sphingobacterium hungaricum]
MADRLIKSSKLRVGDISISYYSKKATDKERQVIIFLHGFPFNKNSWRDQLSALADDVTGIAIDIRGHGNSTSGHGFFSIDVFAKDLRVFMEKLEIEKAVLCGVSMGGYIVLRTFQLIPDKISGLILSDTHSKADDDKGKQKRFDSIQAVLQFGRRPFAIGFIENLFTKETIDEKPETVELIKSSIRRNSVNSICATLLALASRTDTTSSLEKIKVPTLVIRGKEDKITPENLMSELANDIPGAEYIQFENCGHLPNLEDPERFNQVLKDFLEKVN